MYYFCWHLNIQIEINIFVLYLHHRNTQMIWIHTEENIFYICTQRQDIRLDTDTDHLGPTLASPHPSDCSSWHPGPGASTEGRSTQTHWHCPHSLGSSSSSSSSSWPVCLRGLDPGPCQPPQCPLSSWARESLWFSAAAQMWAVSPPPQSL